MRAVQFPPICPFGNVHDDGLQIDLVEATINVFPLTEARDLFIRINTYADDSSVTYLIGNRKEIQNDLLDRLSGWEPTLGENDLAKLRKWKLRRLLKTINKP